MPFNYKIADDKRLVFTRSGAGCARAFIFFIGAVFTIAGAFMLALATDPKPIIQVMRFIFPAAGIGATYLGIILPRIQGKTTPDRIIFDNAKGRVEINQQASDIKTGYIYYDEIQDFIIRSKSQRDSDTGRDRTSYHVYLAKKDGGQWELLVTGSHESAAAEINKIREMVDLSAAPQREKPNIEASQKYKIKRGSERTEICWQNKPGKGPIGLIIFSLVFITVAYAIMATVFELEGGFPWFAYLILGFIGAMFALVIGVNIRKMIKNSNTEYAVSISGMSLDYIERDLQGREKKSTCVPLKDIHALSFSFDTDSTMRKIFIYTHEQFKEKDEITPSFSIESIKNIYNFYKNLVSLEIQDLTAVEALQMETYLQQLITEKSDVKVD